MYFESEAKVNYYDCDCNNQLKISSAMKYMQQASSEQLDYLGFSVEKLYAEQMVFLLSKMCIKVHRMPVCSERLVIGTAPITPRGVRFVREFVIDSPVGERLVSALSLWVLVNPASRRILRPASFPYMLSFQESTLAEIIDDIAFPRRSGVDAIRTSMPVHYSHIDVNRHVNNTVYADIVCDVLPYEPLTTQGIDTMVISFQNEAYFGDNVELSLFGVGEEEYHIIGLHSRGPCFEALVCLRKSE